VSFAPTLAKLITVEVASGRQQLTLSSGLFLLRAAGAAKACSIERLEN
jgi:hypothetical protein